MHEITNTDLISQQELCRAAGIDHHSLRRLRKWLFLEPVRAFPGRGSVSYYSKSAESMIRRFYELRCQTRKIDECVWRLWIEDFPIPIRDWALGRLLPYEGAITVSVSDDIEEKFRKPAMARLSTKPVRTEARHAIDGRLGSNAARSLMHWAIDVMAGLAPAKSLHDPNSPSFDALKKAAGLTGNWSPPDLELSIESLSVSRLCEILRNATPSELDQARRDWAMIAQLVDTSDTVDWRSARKTLDVQRTSSAQPVAPADFLIALWRDFDARAVLLAGLIHIRRSAGHSQRVSELLALLSWIFNQLPRTKAPAL